MSGNYRNVYEESITNPEGFWGRVASDIIWYKKYSVVLDDSDKPLYKWFVGGELNTCYNALDYHVENGLADKIAIIYDSPVTGTIRKITYRELLDRVAKLAGAFSEKGITKGDRVIIYMPMIPEAVTAMLACARIGAIHSVVFGGFAPDELAARIEDAQPKMIISASCGIEGEKIIEIFITEGEEDLLGIPAVVLAPIGTLIFYGQPEVLEYPSGLVMVEVTVEKKREFQGYLDQMQKIGD